ncbi:hypothetical protein H4R20_003263, partial [Coemansia guatemalensis]
QYERAPSAPAAGEDSPTKPAMPAGLTQPPVSPTAASLRGPGTTMSSPTGSSAAATHVAAPTPKAVSGGWEFNDDWDEGGGDDGWGLDNDDDLWNAEESNSHSNDSKAAAQTKPSAAPALAPRTSNEPLPSISKVTKTPLKLAKTAPKKPAPTSTSKRKGLGAMKLGGASKNDALLDELL